MKNKKILFFYLKKKRNKLRKCEQPYFEEIKNFITKVKLFRETRKNLNV
jgi:hypothetical protein